MSRLRAVARRPRMTTSLTCSPAKSSPLELREVGIVHEPAHRVLATAGDSWPAFENQLTRGLRGICRAESPNVALHARLQRRPGGLHDQSNVTATPTPSPAASQTDCDHDAHNLAALNTRGHRRYRIPRSRTSPVQRDVHSTLRRLEQCLGFASTASSLPPAETRSNVATRLVKRAATPGCELSLAWGWIEFGIADLRRWHEPAAETTRARRMHEVSDADLPRRVDRVQFGGPRKNWSRRSRRG